jgi:phage replication O-like protein O
VDDTSPQLENGYTRLANELLDALLCAGLTARQWAVVMAIARKTYGWNKTKDDIGLSQLSLLTGIDKAHLSRTVRELESLGIVHREPGMHSHTLGINKRYKEWRLPNQQPQLPKEQQLPNQQPGVAESATQGLPNQQPGGCRISNRGVAESATLGVAESATQGLPNQQPQNCIKDKGKTTPKDKTLSASLRESFDRFYAAYPKKRKKAQAEKAFAKLNPDESLLQTMLEAVEVAKRSRDDWRKDGGQFIPYPASWLNGRMWEDEPDQTEYSPQELAVIELYNEVMPSAWARAVASPFVASRASAIREFLGFAPTKPGMPRNYFAHCAANLAVDERCGFDWLIRKETYLRVREGAVKHKDAA